METESLLRAVSLNAYEVKAYLALLKSAAITAYELGKLAGVPAGRIYDIVDSLMLRGLVEQKAGKPKKFAAIKPEVALSALLAKKNKEWEETKGKVTALIGKLKQKERAKEPFSILKGEYLHFTLARDLILEAKNEVLISVPNLVGKRKGIDIRPIALKKKKEGVSMKIILPDIRDAGRPIEQILRTAKVREYKFPADLKLIIADSKSCILTVPDPALPEQAILKVENVAFAKVMRELFYAIWEKAKPVKI